MHELLGDGVDGLRRVVRLLVQLKEVGQRSLFQATLSSSLGVPAHAARAGMVLEQALLRSECVQEFLGCLPLLAGAAVGGDSRGASAVGGDVGVCVGVGAWGLLRRGRPFRVIAMWSREAAAAARGTLC